MDEQVVCGTHGRLKTWMGKRIMPIQHIKILVFDEADEMLKVGPSCVTSHVVSFHNSVSSSTL